MMRMMRMMRMIKKRMSKNYLNSDSEVMSLDNHIKELRNRMLLVLSYFFICFILAMFFISKEVILFLINDNDINITVFQFSPSDGLKIYVKVSLFISILATVPFFMYQAWKFCQVKQEKKQLYKFLMYVTFAVISFSIGIFFAYYILVPNIYAFMQSISASLMLEDVIGITQYISFVIQLSLPISLAFTLPIISGFLTELKLVNPEQLKRIRKYMYFALFIISALVTPPDFLSAIFVSIPLILVYELSILTSKFFYKERKT